MKVTFQTHRKSNNKPLYICACSNYSPAIIKQIPQSVDRRLPDITSTGTIAAPKYYETYLNDSGFSATLHAHDTTQ